VPFYRDHWSARRRAGDRSSASYLENWPVVSKETVRESPATFLADDCDPRKMFLERTSGTSGKSTTLWWSKPLVRQWYALMEARVRRWNGVSRDDRWGIIGGQLVTPAAQTKPPFWVWNVALKQLYLSAWHMSAANMAFYLDAIRHYRLRYLFGYTSALTTLAEAAVVTGTSLKLSVVISNAEPVFPHQRRLIETAFQCPFRETYGMSEIVATASECERGTLHLWHDVGIVEQNAAPEREGSGSLVCTGLLNKDMPLIRYEVGDRGRVNPSLSTCACGRTHPALQEVEGRSDDVLYTQDGRQIGQLQSVFQTVQHIREAQLVQETLTRVKIRVVPAPGYGDSDREVILQRFRSRVAGISPVLEEVTDIPRTANGKLKYVVCQIPPAELASIRI
jgi:phenylacetate-CoA ligase